MTQLPVTQMVLYKHGVGFFVRSGELEGDSLQLNFRRDEINDILKSLAVFDLAGGQVLGLHYQTPMDKTARLASSSINLAEHNSLLDLIRGLRGRLVELDGDKKLKHLQGRVMGYQEAEDEKDILLALLTQTDQVQLIPIEDVRTLRLLDAQSQADLSYFLDTSMSEEERRSIQVRLSPGQHELVVQYVAPSPTWRVSYRVVAESNPKRKGKGKLLLQGWALFDNRLEEDLENVQVTLVAGQPISFIYDLYESQIPQRPTIKDEARIAIGPIEYAGAVIDPNTGLPEGVDPMRYLEKLGKAGGVDERYFIAEANEEIPSALRRNSEAFAFIDKYQSAPSRRQAAQSVEVDIQTKATGETFQYIVNTPVTVKRGESALVPFLNVEADYERELLYNGEKLPNHPVAALRFKNRSGLTLERGPVTVTENGDYKGEAILPFSKATDEIYLPFAVELGVKITELPHFHTETLGLAIQKEYLVFDTYSIQSVTYTIENSLSEAITLLIEVPKPPRSTYEPFDMPPSQMENATAYRWKVTCPARQQVEFRYQSRFRHSRQEVIWNTSYDNLASFLQNRWLDQATFDRLKGLLDLQSQIKEVENRLLKLTKGRESLYKQQEQARENLKSLGNHPDEQPLRKRMLDQLDQTQTQLDAIESDEKAFTEQIRQSRDSIAQQLASLV